MTTRVLRGPSCRAPCEGARPLCLSLPVVDPVGAISLTCGVLSRGTGVASLPGPSASVVKVGWSSVEASDEADLEADS